ncbi:hypothetical protein PoB_004505100 [Plakobranchus ocellatus]|uniref:Uncharacterized protein n=1 Tax=Plakobranchus ocellatus TaxID=259542 RepID=A0AAV4BDQ2_9GAST|nr:hypothetical protein PoB_004505100 [Plakobranchus ocellatus]
MPYAWNNLKTTMFFYPRVNRMSEHLIDLTPFTVKRTDVLKWLDVRADYVVIHHHHHRGVGGAVDSEFALRSAGILLTRVRRASQPTPWLDRGPESLRSPCFGLAMHKKPHHQQHNFNYDPQLVEGFVTPM